MKHPTRKHQYILNVKKNFKTGDSFFSVFLPVLFKYMYGKMFNVIYSF